MVALNYEQKLHLVVGEGQVPNACTNNDMTWHDKTVNKISLAIPVQIQHFCYVLFLHNSILFYTDLRRGFYVTFRFNLFNGAL